MRLTKGMFGIGTSSRENFSRENLFGIHIGQIRCDEIAHNGGWYNQYGADLGWGDLSAEDFQRISAELEDDELFIVLSEGNSRLTHESTNYMVKLAMYIIAKGRCYVVDRYSRAPKDIVVSGQPFKALSPRAARALITAKVITTHPKVQEFLDALAESHINAADEIWVVDVSAKSLLCNREYVPPQPKMFILVQALGRTGMPKAKVFAAMNPAGVKTGRKTLLVSDIIALVKEHFTA